MDSRLVVEDRPSELSHTCIYCLTSIDLYPKLIIVLRNIIERVLHTLSCMYVHRSTLIYALVCIHTL